jgi:hypothetical protein
LIIREIEDGENLLLLDGWVDVKKLVDSLSPSRKSIKL